MLEEHPLRQSKFIWEIISKEKSALEDYLYFERAREEIISIIENKALFKGDFTLASGKKSSYYLDLRRITLDSEAAPFIGYMILFRLFELDPSIDSVAGPTLGADPLVSSALALAPLFQLNLKGLIVRKEKKEHGLMKLIEGNLDAVKKTVCVEDVTTTGGSLLRACSILKEAGIEVVAAISLVDREEEDLKEKFASMGIKFSPIIKISEILMRRGDS